jgi:hypothetical protein
VPIWHTPPRNTPLLSLYGSGTLRRMWPWTRREPAQDDLRTRVADLESAILRLRAEWADVLDRLLRLDERQRKRAERAESSGPPQDTRAARKAVLRLRMNAHAARRE